MLSPINKQNVFDFSVQKVQMGKLENFGHGSSILSTVFTHRSNLIQITARPRGLFLFCVAFVSWSIPGVWQYQTQSNKDPIWPAEPHFLCSLVRVHQWAHSICTSREPSERKWLCSASNTHRRFQWRLALCANRTLPTPTTPKQDHPARRTLTSPDVMPSPPTLDRPGSEIGNPGLNQ